MGLLITFIVCLIVGQALNVTLGLIVEQFTSSHTSLLVFIPLYFSMFWIAWKVAVRITEPKTPAIAGDAAMSHPAPAAAPPQRDAAAKVETRVETRLESRDAPA